MTLVLPCPRDPMPMGAAGPDRVGAAEHLSRHCICISAAFAHPTGDGLRQIL
jgi:hypothetical protein